MEIIPAILTGDTGELEIKLKKFKDKFSRVHIDLIDGEFVNGRTIEVEALGKLDVDILLDAHLMVKEPEFWIERCMRSMVDRIMGQVEQMSDQFKFVTKIQEVGHESGLALDFATSLDVLDKEALKYTDVVLLMGHRAGYQGGQLEFGVFEKIKKLQTLKEEVSAKFKICLDGGVNKENLRKIEDLGVEEVVVGHGIDEVLR